MVPADFRFLNDLPIYPAGTDPQPNDLIWIDQVQPGGTFISRKIPFSRIGGSTVMVVTDLPEYMNELPLTGPPAGQGNDAILDALNSLTLWRWQGTLGYDPVITHDAERTITIDEDILPSYNRAAPTSAFSYYGSRQSFEGSPLKMFFTNDYLVVAFPSYSTPPDTGFYFTPTTIGSLALKYININTGEVNETLSVEGAAIPLSIMLANRRYDNSVDFTFGNGKVYFWGNTGNGAAKATNTLASTINQYAAYSTSCGKILIYDPVSKTVNSSINIEALLAAENDSTETALTVADQLLPCGLAHIGTNQLCLAFYFRDSASPNQINFHFLVIDVSDPSAPAKVASSKSQINTVGFCQGAFSDGVYIWIGDRITKAKAFQLKDSQNNWTFTETPARDLVFLKENPNDRLTGLASNGDIFFTIRNWNNLPAGSEAEQLSSANDSIRATDYASGGWHKVGDNYEPVHALARNISVDTTNFSKNLTALDNTVQKALERIDQIMTSMGGGGLSQSEVQALIDGAGHASNSAVQAILTAQAAVNTHLTTDLSILHNFVNLHDDVAADLAHTSEKQWVTVTDDTVAAFALFTGRPTALAAENLTGALGGWRTSFSYSISTTAANDVVLRVPVGTDVRDVQLDYTSTGESEHSYLRGGSFILLTSVGLFEYYYSSSRVESTSQIKIQHDPNALITSSFRGHIGHAAVATGGFGNNIPTATAPNLLAILGVIDQLSLGGGGIVRPGADGRLRDATTADINRVAVDASGNIRVGVKTGKPTVEYRDFVSSDLPTTGKRWRGLVDYAVHIQNPEVGDVCYPIGWGTFSEYISQGSTGIWVGYQNPFPYRGYWPDQETADAHIQAIGDIVLYGNVAKVVTGPSPFVPHASPTVSWQRQPELQALFAEVAALQLNEISFDADQAGNGALKIPAEETVTPLTEVDVFSVAGYAVDGVLANIRDINSNQLDFTAGRTVPANWQLPASVSNTTSKIYLSALGLTGFRLFELNTGATPIDFDTSVAHDIAILTRNTAGTILSIKVSEITRTSEGSYSFPENAIYSGADIDIAIVNTHTLGDSLDLATGILSVEGTAEVSQKIITGKALALRVDQETLPQRDLLEQEIKDLQKRTSEIGLYGQVSSTTIQIADGLHLGHEIPIGGERTVTSTPASFPMVSGTFTVPANEQLNVPGSAFSSEFSSDISTLGSDSQGVWIQPTSSGVAKYFAGNFQAVDLITIDGTDYFPGPLSDGTYSERGGGGAYIGLWKSTTEGLTGTEFNAILASVGAGNTVSISFNKVFTGYSGVVANSTSTIYGTPVAYTADTDKGRAARTLIGILEDDSCATADSTGPIYYKESSGIGVTTFHSITVCGGATQAYGSPFGDHRMTEVVYKKSGVYRKFVYSGGASDNPSTAAGVKALYTESGGTVTVLTPVENLLFSTFLYNISTNRHNVITAKLKAEVNKNLAQAVLTQGRRAERVDFSGLNFISATGDEVLQATLPNRSGNKFISYAKNNYFINGERQKLTFSWRNGAESRTPIKIHFTEGDVEDTANLHRYTDSRLVGGFTRYITVVTYDLTEAQLEAKAWQIEYSDGTFESHTIDTRNGRKNFFELNDWVPIDVPGDLVNKYYSKVLDSPLQVSGLLSFERQTEPPQKTKFDGFTRAFFPVRSTPSVTDPLYKPLDIVQAEIPLGPFTGDPVMNVGAHGSYIGFARGALTNFTTQGFGSIPLITDVRLQAIIVESSARKQVYVIGNSLINTNAMKQLIVGNTAYSLSNSVMDSGGTFFKLVEDGNGNALQMDDSPLKDIVSGGYTNVAVRLSGDQYIGSVTPTFELGQLMQLAEDRSAWNKMYLTDSKVPQIVRKVGRQGSGEIALNNTTHTTVVSITIPPTFAATVLHIRAICHTRAGSGVTTNTTLGFQVALTAQYGTQIETTIPPQPYVDATVYNGYGPTLTWELTHKPGLTTLPAVFRFKVRLASNIAVSAVGGHMHIEHHVEGIDEES